MNGRFEVRGRSFVPLSAFASDIGSSIFHDYNLLMTRYLRHWQLPRFISKNAFHCHTLQGF
jgi:hypothetical protein